MNDQLGANAGMGMPGPAMPRLRTGGKADMPEAEDPIQKVLRMAPALPQDRAAAYEAFYATKDEDEFGEILDNIKLPRQVKAFLWDQKYAASLPQSSEQGLPAAGPVPFKEGTRPGTGQEVFNQSDPGLQATDAAVAGIGGTMLLGPAGRALPGMLGRGAAALGSTAKGAGVLAGGVALAQGKGVQQAVGEGVAVGVGAKGLGGLARLIPFVSKGLAARFTHAVGREAVPTSFAGARAASPGIPAAQAAAEGKAAAQEMVQAFEAAAPAEQAAMLKAAGGPAGAKEIARVAQAEVSELERQLTASVQGAVKPAAERTSQSIAHDLVRKWEALPDAASRLQFKADLTKLGIPGVKNIADLKKLAGWQPSTTTRAQRARFETREE